MKLSEPPVVGDDGEEGDDILELSQIPDAEGDEGSEDAPYDPNGTEDDKQWWMMIANNFLLKKATCLLTNC